MKLRRKSDTWWMRAVGLVSPDFLTRYWTTVGRTVYVPTIYDHDRDWGTPSWKMRHDATLSHEAVHIGQFDDLGWLSFFILYFGPSPVILALAGLAWPISTVGAVWLCVLAAVLLPLTVGLAFGRMQLECEAYLVQVKRANWSEDTIEWVADTLWRGYGLTVPRGFVRAWFRKRKL